MDKPGPSDSKRKKIIDFSKCIICQKEDSKKKVGLGLKILFKF